MTLSNQDIRAELELGNLRIEPLAEGAIQPASVDLRLGDRFLRHFGGPIDVKEAGTYGKWIPLQHDTLCVKPGFFFLASTIERVRIPDYLVGRVEGKSSLGRLGITVHATAGYIDAGFEGQITLEIHNQLDVAVTLHAGMPVSQLSLMRLSSPAHPAYAGKYQQQDGPRVSEYWRNFKEAK